VRNEILSISVLFCFSVFLNFFIRLKDSGTVWTWGCGYSGRTGHCDEKNISIPALVKKLLEQITIFLSCGGEHSLCLTNDGTVYAFGNNSWGQVRGRKRRPYSIFLSSLTISLFFLLKKKKTS
jgi:alpha-tubulin suppressor-like RCC1 family protein